ncbi:MAG: hypothetical protein ORN55_00725 [Chitinophagaceae bacterium]|nr:hypothetical protein [Chitinophagaceae bacterium]
MITEQEFHAMAMGIQLTSFETKGEVTRYMVCKKKFASIRYYKGRASVKLSILDQDVFCSFDTMVMYPIPNRAGKNGWTHINVNNIKKDMCLDAITMAYCEVAPKDLAAQYAYDDNL